MYWSGTEGTHNLIVTDLLGSNLEEVMRLCNGNLSQSTIIALADQLIARVEFMHSTIYLHRDI